MDELLVKDFLNMLEAGVIFTYSDVLKLTDQEKQAFAVAAELYKAEKVVELKEILVDVLYPSEKAIKQMEDQNKQADLNNRLLDAQRRMLEYTRGS